MKRKKKKIPSQLKAIRKGNREAEFEILGPGFHSKQKVNQSHKLYNRKKYKKPTSPED